MASEELVNRLRERATTLWQWAGKAERTTGPSATTGQWRIDGDLHDDAATEIDRLARELEATRAALMIAQTTAANLHDTIRLRDRELEEARERARQREHQRDAAEAEVQRLRRALRAVRECAHLATARRIAGEALYTTIEGDSRMDTETRQGLAAEERRNLTADTEVSGGE